MRKIRLSALQKRTVLTDKKVKNQLTTADKINMSNVVFQIFSWFRSNVPPTRSITKNIGTRSGLMIWRCDCRVLTTLIFRHAATNSGQRYPYLAGRYEPAPIGGSCALSHLQSQQVIIIIFMFSSLP